MLQFPKHPEKRMQNIISCLNTEPKNILQAFCLDRIWKSSDDLREDFSDLVSPEFAPTKQDIYEYIDCTLRPKKIVRRNGDRWMSTINGATFSSPFAAYSLKFAVDTGHSMYEYLGVTCSSGNTSGPYNRIRIMEKITDGCREIDLAQYLGLHPTVVQKHLRALKKLGIIEFESFEHPEVVYDWVNGKNTEEVEPVYGDKKLIEYVANKISETGSNNIHHLTETLKMPVYRIAVALSGLHKQGFIRPKKFTARRKKSDILLLEDASDFRGFISDLRASLSSPTDKIMDIYIEMAVNDRLRRRYCNAAMELYKKSLFIKRKNCNVINEIPM